MSEALRDQFERFRYLIGEALAVDDEATPDELLSEILAGRAQLWPSEGAFVVTQCVERDGERSIHAWCGGGILTEMVALRPGIEAWGRAMGARWATIDSRPGWLRLYHSFGYEPFEGRLRKAL